MFYSHDELSSKVSDAVNRGYLTEEDANCILSDKYAADEFINDYSLFGDEMMDAEDIMQERRQHPSDDGEY